MSKQIIKLPKLPKRSTPPSFPTSKPSTKTLHLRSKLCDYLQEIKLLESIYNLEMKITLNVNK
jgi:hypothetical protein